VKMDDIAKLAQVSKSAVSLALSGKPGIGPETRERILQIAKENGYNHKTKPQQTDRTGKSLLFLVFSNSGIVLEKYYQQPFFRELIHFIEERCRQKGYSLVFSSVDMESFDTDIRTIADENQTGGVILLGTNLDRPSIENLADKWSNLVVLDTCYETLPVHFLEINNVMGAYQAGTYLCDIGHREIGYVASDVRIHNFDARRRGFMSSLAERGLQVAEDHTFYVAPTILSSQEAMRQQLESYVQGGSKLPTALFCECDYIAISAMKTLTEMGYRIPEDISVIGFDNITESLIISPELTTIHVDKEQLARMAVDLLIDSIDGSRGNVKIKTAVDTKFIERQSCSAPAVIVDTNA